MKNSDRFSVTVRGMALAAAAAGSLVGTACQSNYQPPPPPAPYTPGFAPPAPSRYGYQGTQSPNYTEPRQAAPARPAPPVIKRDPNNTTVDLTPPPRKTAPEKTVTPAPAPEPAPAPVTPSSFPEPAPAAPGPEAAPDPAAPAPSAPAPSAPEPAPAVKPAPREDLPYGIPVVGKSGMVYSPYAEDKGQVDVEGLKRGTRVKCPYTGKHFRVP